MGFETSGNGEAFGKGKSSHLKLFIHVQKFKHNIVPNRKPPGVIWHQGSSLPLPPPPRLTNAQILKLISRAGVKQHQTEPLEKAQQTTHVSIWLKIYRSHAS